MVDVFCAFGHLCHELDALQLIFGSALYLEEFICVWSCLVIFWSEDVVFHRGSVGTSVTLVSLALVPRLCQWFSLGFLC